MAKVSLKRQVAQMKRIIRKDANAIGTLLDGDGKMCAVGGLAYYGAGVTQEELRDMDTGDAFDRVVNRFPVLRLAHVACDEIVDLNDKTKTLIGRRNKLCRFFDNLPRRAELD